MPDAGEVKAKVVIEYDGSGLEQAKKDLASLGEMAGAFGSGGGGGGAGGGGLPAFAQQISSVLSPMQQLRGAFEQMLPLVTQQNAAFDQLPRSLVSTVAPMQQLQGTMMQMIPALPQMVQGFSQVSDVTSGALPRSLASTVAPMQQLQGVVSQSAFALAPYAGGLEQVQQAADPLGHTIVTMVDPMSEVQQIAGDTGAIQLPLLASSLHETQGATDAFTQSYGAMNSAFSQYSKGMPPPIDQATIDLMNSIPTVAGNYGTAWSDIVAQQEEVKAGGGLFSGLFGEGGFLGGFGGTFSDLWGGVTKLGQGMMEIMWPAQMVGQAVGGFGQSMYNAAVIAEGPAAHSFSTFTGQLDLLGKSSQQSFGTFSESFGKQMMPSLGVLNAIQQGGGGTSSGWGNVLGFIGNALTMGGMGLGGWMQFAGSGGERAPAGVFPPGPPPPGGWGPVPPYTAGGPIFGYNAQGQPIYEGASTLHAMDLGPNWLSKGPSPITFPTGSFTMGDPSLAAQMVRGMGLDMGQMQTTSLGISSLPNLSGITSGISSMLSSALSGLSSISMPSMPSMSLGGIASGIGSMLSSALSGLGSISMPSISLGGIASGVSSMLSSALSGLSGISLPSVSLGGIASGVAAMLSGALSSLTGISLPSISLGGLVSSIGSAISSAFSALSNISIPGLPHFASGVENFSGGWAIVGEHGPEPVRLPAGSSVYPASSGAGISSLAGGIGGGFGGPQTINFTFQLDSQTLVSTMGIPLASAIRLSNGYRGA